MLTKITLEVARSKNAWGETFGDQKRYRLVCWDCMQDVLVHLRPSSKLWTWIVQHFQMYTWTFFLLLCLPKALRYHLTVYKHVCMVGNASISAKRRICGFTHIQVCCVRKGFKDLVQLVLCSKWLMDTFLQRRNCRQSFKQSKDQRACRSRSRPAQDGHSHASRLITVRADVTWLQHGFHVVAVRMCSKELDFYSRFCSTPPPPPPQLPTHTLHTRTNTNTHTRARSHKRTHRWISQGHPGIQQFRVCQAMLSTKLII